MKNQALFSSKDKSKKLKCHLLQFLFGTLRVKTYIRTALMRNSNNHHSYKQKLSQNSMYRLFAKKWRAKNQFNFITTE